MTTTEPGPRTGSTDLGDRTTYIGGSDMPAILGVSPYESRLDLWRLKCGLAPPKEETDAMRWGHLHEPNIANEFSVRTGKKVQQRRQAYVDREVPVIQGHIDRIVIGEDAILECKSTGAWNASQWGDEWTDDIPRQHIVQVQTYLMLTGRSTAYVAVLIGGNDFRTYVVKAKREWHDVIRQEAEFFWKLVQTRTEPDPDTDAEAAARWTKATDDTMEATGDVLELIKGYEAAKAAERAAKLEAEEWAIQIKNQMEDKCAILSDGRKLLTWRNQTTTRLDTKAIKAEHPDICARYLKTTESRVFRLAKGVQR